jgi:hypothetical protein
MRTTDALLIAALLGAWPAAALDPAASMGRERAATSPIEWEIREAGHPALGNIRFAYIKRPLETRVGSQTVYSRAYLSCQKDKKSFAIELANATAPADPGGLKPASDPRLVCQRPAADGKVVREEILASWHINEKIGDALTRGLRAFPLRECAAIAVHQEVILPEGWPQKTARIEFELLPYNFEVDAIFATCGEQSAYGPGIAGTAVAASPSPAPAAPRAAASVAAAPKPVAAATAAPKPVVAVPKLAAAVSPTPAVSAPQEAAPAQDGWREARSIPTGKTNVRGGPSLQGRIVAELHPGSVVLVQRTDTEWWRARPNKGTAWEGYIRQDRLVFK